MMYSKITFLLVACTLACTDGGEIYNIAGGRSYFISQPQKETWFNAFRYCSYIGQYLVDIRNDYEQNRLQVIFKAHSDKFPIADQYWTAGSDLGKEGTFSYISTGQPMLYTNWRSGQPDNRFSSKYNETENCVTILGTTGEWNDAFCVDKHYFICRDTIDVPTYKNHGCADFGVTK